MYSRHQRKYQGGAIYLMKYTDMRFLLIIIVVSQLCVSSVEVSAEDPATRNVARNYRFLARCSQKQVEVKGHKVNASAKWYTNYTILKVESGGIKANGSYYVTLQSVKYKTFICFNRRGGLRVMQNGYHDRCKFREIFTDDRYIEFRLATKEGWYIGFRHNGRPINGTIPRRTRKSKCYQFTRLSVEERTSHGPLKNLGRERLQKFYRRQRRRKGNGRRRQNQRPDQT